MDAAVQDPKQEFLYRLRHSLAHILAQAVLEVRPNARMGFGPPIADGFYYDFDFGEEPLHEADLKDLENRMRRIVKEKQKFEQSFLPLPDAETLLSKSDQHYKIDYARELVAEGKAENGALGFYTNGPFVDMCEGPHLEHTGEVPKACFKLDRMSGSYWRGSEENPMLTRIYGLAFESGEQLKDYIEKRELARQRDHRKLGAELELFMMDDEVGQGLPMWLPYGAVIRDELEAWAREMEFKGGYQRVSTPVLTKGELYEKSGHLAYYKDAMFPPMTCDENEHYYLRPMNCPHHHKIYGARPRSYRELPLRLAEYGNNFRYERSGTLAGLLRVRAMCMNDAHIYCELDQVKREFQAVMDLYRYYYEHLRFQGVRARLSLHDKDKDKFVDNEAAWEHSEAIVREVLIESGIEFDEESGEAAFYGPKLDLQASNLVGREETISTCQLDFVSAERFGLTYITNEGEEKHPFIIHRAPLGTHERFISFLIEQYGGAFPTWMAPVQVCLIPVKDSCNDFTHAIADRLRSSLVRAEIDQSNESFNKRIRRAITHKIPNIWIIGEKEVGAGAVTWRRYCVDEQVTITVDAAVDTMVKLHRERIMDNFADVALPIG